MATLGLGWHMVAPRPRFQTRSHALAHARTHARMTCTHTQVHSRTHADMLTRSHTRTLAQSHAFRKSCMHVCMCVCALQEAIPTNILPRRMIEMPVWIFLKNGKKRMECHTPVWAWCLLQVGSVWKNGHECRRIVDKVAPNNQTKAIRPCGQTFLRLF